MISLSNHSGCFRNTWTPARNPQLCPINVTFSTTEINKDMYIENNYRKRCMFLGEWNNSCSSNSCNLSYLIRQRQQHKKPRSLRFSLHKFVHLNFFWTLFKNVHCQGPCSLRPCISRPYCSTEHCIADHAKLLLSP